MCFFKHGKEQKKMLVVELSLLITGSERERTEII